jgi:hypothetical protein
MGFDGQVQWVEARCTHVRIGSTQPCSRRLALVGIDLLDGRPAVKGYLGLFPARDDREDWVGKFKPPTQNTATQVGGRVLGNGGRGITRIFKCHPKHCGAEYLIREDRLAQLAADELAAGRSRVYLQSR